MGYDCASISKDYVADSDSASLSFSCAYEGVFTAAHGKEEGSAHEMGSCKFSW